MVGEVSLRVKWLEVKLNHFPVDKTTFLDFVDGEKVGSRDE